MASHRHINPDSLFDARQLAYSQAMLSEGSRFVQIAGQAAIGIDFAIIGEGDFGRQVEAVFANVDAALRAAGAARSDVNNVRIYVVDYQPDHSTILQAALRSFFEPGPPPPGTLIGVAALAMPGLLLEIEVTAVL